MSSGDDTSGITGIAGIQILQVLQGYCIKEG